MQCPECPNRGLLVSTPTTAILVFAADGQHVERVYQNPWRLLDTSRCYCAACGWEGLYRECRGETDCTSAS